MMSLTHACILGRDAAIAAKYDEAEEAGKKAVELVKGAINPD